MLGSAWMLAAAVAMGVAPPEPASGCPLMSPLPPRPAPEPTGTVTTASGSQTSQTVAPPPPTVEPYLARVNDRVSQGLFFREQADGSWLVEDMHGRHVATVEGDGRLVHAPRKPESYACSKRSMMGIESTDCASAAVPMAQPGVSGSGGAELGLAAFLTAWALVRHARERSKHPKVRVSDPRPSRQKIRRASRSLRVEVARAWAYRTYCEAVDDLEQALSSAWVQHRSDPGTMRRALFVVWDDVPSRFPRPAVGLPDEAMRRVEAQREEAIEYARGFVVRYAARRFPAGSEHAYGAAELRRLNAKRRSQASFQPYGS